MGFEERRRLKSKMRFKERVGFVKERLEEFPRVGGLRRSETVLWEVRERGEGKDGP